jgi:hypothetical protein
MVDLGRKAPSWGLSRWGLEGLRFSPLDDEGFDLRGDSRTLLYKGKHKSHRFTILNDSAFEYDIILKKQPASNTLFLCIDGWEGFDFFRQPDYASDPALAGSYAVYRRESIIQANCNTGTGKICHIHRPKIIDARGREVWGELWIDRGVMAITIPEQWLADALYPVIVDPIIGCATQGAFSQIYYINQEEYDDYVEMWQECEYTNAEIAAELETFKRLACADSELYFNRYTTAEPMIGKYKVFFHAAKIGSGNYNIFAPVLFNDGQSVPAARISSEEYGFLGASNGAAGWKQVSLNVPNRVDTNSNVWLGMVSNNIGVSFDYGGSFFDISSGFRYVQAKNDISQGKQIGSRFQYAKGYIDEYRMALQYGDAEWIEQLRPSVHEQNNNAHPKKPTRYDYKFSFYFESTAIAYTRYINTGVTLSDTRKHLYNAVRRQMETIKPATSIIPEKGMLRFISTGLEVSDFCKVAQSLVRQFFDTLKSSMEIEQCQGIQRSISDSAFQSDTVERSRGIIRSLIMSIKPGDSVSSSVILLRRLFQGAAVSDGLAHLGAYIRGLYIEAGNMAETGHTASYYRFQNDTVNSITVPFRHLLIFIKIATVGLVRDFILRRFLKAREELVIKSAVCREIIIESRIH